MKLTPKEIIEGNKLIAEFAELPKCADPKHIDDPCFFVEGQYRKAHKLQYDTSWNRLMQVVEKIESLGFDIAYHSKFTYMKEDNTFLNSHHIHIWDESEHLITDLKDEVMIDCFFVAVVEFIKYYNTQKV